MIFTTYRRASSPVVRTPAESASLFAMNTMKCQVYGKKELWRLPGLFLSPENHWLNNSRRKRKRRFRLAACLLEMPSRWLWNVLLKLRNKMKPEPVPALQMRKKHLPKRRVKVGIKIKSFKLCSLMCMTRTLIRACYAVGLVFIAGKYFVLCCLMDAGMKLRWKSPGIWKAQGVGIYPLPNIEIFVPSACL